ncbi:MAG: hypothetical protein JNM24_02315 [Bdellovibrionaceae bacterium]|nr:hypothetical protein [Pseudobdellovibrionaceae bacterium]
MTKNSNKKPRQEIIHIDWITIRGVGASKRGAELLKQVRETIGIHSEGYREGYGGGYYWQQFVDRGLRISTTDDGTVRVEFQGLYFNGGQANPFAEFNKIICQVQTLKDIEWRLTRIDVAIDLYGVEISQAFPDPFLKRYKFNFKFSKADYSDNDSGAELKTTGYTLKKKRTKSSKSRWTLAVYNKRQELEDTQAHQIKKEYFNALSETDVEPITRIELRIATPQGLNHVQGILKNPTTEENLCLILLTHWGKYHKITTQNGNEERRFHRFFRKPQPKPIPKVEMKKIAEIAEQHQEISIRDKAREFLRYGLTKANKTHDELIQIVKDQIEFLKETEDSEV